MSSAKRPADQLPSADWDRLQILVARFEQAWQAAPRPSLADFLQTGVPRLPLLVELIHTDLEYCFKTGAPSRVETYLEQFPDLAADPEAVLQLIGAEYELCRGDPGFTPGDFQRRFPQYASRLGKMLKPALADSRTGRETTLLGGGDATTRPAAEAGPNPALANYEILGELGRGGMGIVYRARDPELNRDLAIKVLRDDRGDDSEVHQRFLEEAQVGAQLQHPGIVPVYEVGGRDRQLPFFTMKLVQGQTLAALLCQRRGPADELPRFLHIFEQVCQTLAYAHARGVIHRDLKPANVMVGAFGEVQVMDWGLAKVLRRPVGEGGATIRTTRTETVGTESVAGSVMGTPAYMAPEQARGELADLDARADVFGLGALLGEVLTGQPPYGGRNVNDVHARAYRADLGDALARLAACGADGELTSLARSCLAADRAARPADGAAVADAMTAYRVEVQRRLHAAEIEAATAVARAEEEKKLRVVEAGRAEAEAARAKAEGRRGLVERQRRRLAVILAAVVVGLVLGGSALWVAYQQEQAGQAAEQARLDAERRLQQQEAQARRERNAEALTEQLARCNTALRENNTLLAAELLKSAERRLPEPGGAALRAQAERYRGGLALLRALDAIDTFRWTSIGNNLPPRKQVASRWRAALADYGMTADQGSAKTAAARLAESVLRERLLLVFDGWLVFEPGAWVRDVLRDADAEPYREAVRDAVAAGEKDQLRELAGRPAALAQPPRFAAALGNNSAVALGRRREVLQVALRSYPGDLPLLMAMGNSYPSNQRQGAAERVRWFQAAVAGHPLSAVAHSSLGNALHDLKDLAGAAAEHRKAIDLDPHNSKAYNNLGTTLLDQKDLTGAVAAYRKAIDLEPNLAMAYNNLGNALANQKNVVGALAAYRKAIDLDPNLALAYHNRGTALADQKDVVGALAAYRKAIDLDPNLAGAYNSLGVALADQGDLAGAVAAYRKAIDLDPNLAVAYNSLGNALGDQKDVASAIAAYRKAIDLDPSYALAYYNLGITLWNQKDLTGAGAAYRKAIDLDPNMAQAHCNLGHVFRQQGRFVEALQELKRGHELGLKQPGWPYPSARWVKQGEQLVALDQKLTAVLAGQTQPNNAAERLALASLCRLYKQYHATAADLYGRVFSDQPGLANDLDRGDRYLAACSAALAAAGQTQDPGKLTAAKQTQLRALALVWLQADLQQWTKHFQARDLKALPGLLTRLPGWQQETAFVGFRDPKERAKLPAEEQLSWQKLWAGVDELLKQIAAQVRTERFTGTLTAKDKKRVHEVKLQAGQVYLIDLKSTKFDAYLQLHNAQGKLLAENDDIAPDNQNSRLIFTAPKDGIYRLVATSFEQRGSGAYTLTVRSFVVSKQ